MWSYSLKYFSSCTQYARIILCKIRSFYTFLIEFVLHRLNSCREMALKEKVTTSSRVRISFLKFIENHLLLGNK